MAELKPCPFCGGEALLKGDIRYPRPACEATPAFEVICENIDCIIYNADDVYFLRPEDAVEAWNRRVKNDK